MEAFTAASHGDVLRLVMQVALLLFTARVLGEVARRYGQPSVVGESLAGILLGPSLLSSVVPALGEYIVPQTPGQGYLLEVVALFDAMFLMLITGLETDLALIQRHFRTAIGVSLGGVSVTFATGFALGMLLPDTMRGANATAQTFALFVGTAMSISENNITGGMAEGIIDPFEMVTIKYADDKRVKASVHKRFLMI